MRGALPEGALPGHGSAVDLCALFMAGGGGPPPASSEKRKRWHPDTGLVAFLVLLGACAASIAAFWTQLLSAEVRAQELRTLAVESVVLVMGASWLQEYLTLFHRQQLQRGFLRFCKRMGGLLPIPLTVASYAVSATLLASITLEGHIARLVLHLILGFEIAFLAGVVSFYFWCIVVLRAEHELPDAYEELSSVSSLRSEEISYREEEGLVERQAALLQFQQENMQRLNHEILRLQERLSQQTHFAGEDAMRQVEASQLLAVREQEQQAMAAEREQLQAELLRAHGMLAEQQDECARLRNGNQQYVDENARLRLMLEEWSARSAKLEIALDAQLRLAGELQAQLQVGSRGV